MTTVTEIVARLKKRRKLLLEINETEFAADLKAAIDVINDRCKPKAKYGA